MNNKYFKTIEWMQKKCNDVKMILIIQKQNYLNSTRLMTHYVYKCAVGAFTFLIDMTIRSLFVFVLI